MTKLLVAVSIALLGACVVLSLLLHREREHLASSRAAHAQAVEAKQREVEIARNAVKVAQEAASRATQAREDAEKRLQDARAAVPARLLIEREREAQTLSEAPSLDGAKASLEAAGVPAADLLTLSSTLAASWAATARWRRVAAETQVKLEIKSLELDAVRGMLVEARTEGDLRGAELGLQIKTLGRTIAEKDRDLSSRVSRTRRTVSAVSVGALVGGVAAAGLGLVLCPDARCREVLGLGGAGLAVAGGAGAVLSW